MLSSIHHYEKDDAVKETKNFLEANFKQKVDNNH